MYGIEIYKGPGQTCRKEQRREQQQAEEGLSRVAGGRGASQVLGKCSTMPVNMDFTYDSK